MKAKTLLPIIALCAGSSLCSSALLADEAGIDQKTTLRTQNPWAVSQVMDAMVKDNQGDNLGRIKDVVIDPANGRATFAIIKLSGDVGPRGDYAPVPWALLSPATTTKAGEPKTFVLNVDRDKFASSQKFYLKHWPDNNEATWGPDLYSYYGLDFKTGSAVGAPSAEVPVVTGSEYYYHRDMRAYGPTRPDGTPIDNGTAPDGKGTFVKGPRY